MMGYLDLIMVVIAAAVLWRAPSYETVLLFAYFSVSSIITLFLDAVGYFNILGADWFTIYAAWLAIFVITTGVRQIAYLYCAQQIVCLWIVLQWHSDYSVVYDYYEYLIAAIYLKQLGCAHGNYHSCDTDQRNGLGFYLAHNRA